MPDDIPNFPTEENARHLGDYFDLQKKLIDVYKKQKENLKELAEIDKNIANSVSKRYAEQEKLIQSQKDGYKNLEKQIMATATIAEGADKVAAENAIKSMKAQLKMWSNQFDLYNLQNEFEIEQAKRLGLENQKWNTFGLKMMQQILGLESKRLVLHKDISKLLKSEPYDMGMFADIVATAAVYLKDVVELFIKFDNAAAGFRMSMGALRFDVKDIKKQAESLALAFGHVGVNIQGAYDAFKALTSEMGSTFTVTKDLVKTTSLLKAQLGISEDSTAGFLRNMASISQSTMQTQNAMAYVASNLGKAAGIPLNLIFGDIAKMSSTALTMVSRMPMQIIKTAIEARRLSTTINDMAAGSREILNFTDNVNAEMEASVLIGKNINLQLARELAYRRDIQGSTNEILRIANKIDFQNLDTFQMEAFAHATGRSVEELLKMIQAEKQWDIARRDPLLSGKVAAYEQLKNSTDAIAISNGKNLELMIQQKSNQAQLVAISQKWQQIVDQVASVALPLVNWFLAAVIPAMDIATGLAQWYFSLKSIMPLISGLYKLIYPVWQGITEISSIMGEWVFNIGKFINFIDKIPAKVGEFLLPFAKGLGIVGKIGVFFGKWLEPIGWVITAGQFIYNIFKRIEDTDFVSGDLWGNIEKGVGAVLGALYDTLIQPFVDAKNYIMSWWGANSPSKLGLSIVHGIENVGGMLFDSLTAPFRMGFAWILDKIPGMANISNAIKGGLTKSIQDSASIKIDPNITAVPRDGATNESDQNQKNENNQKKENSTSLSDIYDMLKLLHDDLTSGKVKAGDVYLDGSLLSTQLGKSIEFRGGYGTNH